jgi:DNA-binding response OmpR family regulator
MDVRVPAASKHREVVLMHVLLIEDEPRLATDVRKELNEQGYAVDIAGGGEEALDWVDTDLHDVIVLDSVLPDIDGLEVCRRLRRQQVQTPILLLTANDAMADRVAGLDAGADDSLSKPFAFSELAARLRALTRRRPIVDN